MLKKFSFILVLIGLFSFLQALDLNDVSKSAVKENKLILLSVESENCRYCDKMNKEVFVPNEYASKISKNYIQKIVMIENFDLPKNLKVKYYPTNYILDPKTMAIVDEFVGYIQAADFISLLDLVYEQEVSNQ
jgi:thioredoxin-related protein